MGASPVRRRRLLPGLIAAALVSPLSVPGIEVVSPAPASAAEPVPPAVYVINALDAPVGAVARAVNDAGTVVGGMLDRHSFRFRDDELTDLGPGGAVAVSEFGTVFGHGFGTGAGGTARAVTPNGTVAAGSTFHPGVSVIDPAYGSRISIPGIWTEAGGWNSLYDDGCVVPGLKGGTAMAINAAGVLVGQGLGGDSGYPLTGVRGIALRCTPDPSNPGSYTAHDLAPSGGSAAGAFAINAAGTVAGKAQSAGAIEAHIWEGAAANYRPLGTYADGHPPADRTISQSAAFGINDHGDVVGTYGPAADNPYLMVGNTTNRAFLWTEQGGMQDLTDLLGADSDWTLHTAFDINASGQVVGQGTLNGDLRPFLLTPRTDRNIVASNIMVTQVIQNERNLDLLVAGKPTYAIVRARSQLGDVQGVTARLSAYRNGQLLGTLQPVNPRITVRPNPRVDATDASFVFVLNPGWTSRGTLTLQAKVNPDFSAQETRYTDNQTPRTSVVFASSPATFEIAVVDAYWKGSPVPPPNRAAFDRLRTLVTRLLPTSNVVIRHLPQPVEIPFHFGSTDVCSDVVAELAKVRRSMNVDARTLLYAQMPLWSDGRSPYSWFDPTLTVHDAGLAGCSFVPDMVATGWTHNWSEQIAAHELFHALGRNHVEYCGAVGHDTQEYPHSGDWGRIYGGSLHHDEFPLPDGYDLGFDGRRFLPYGMPSDIMTYCFNSGLWASDYTYENLYALIPEIGTRPRASLQHAVNIVGTIDLLTGAVDVSLTDAQPESPTPAPVPGPYHIEMYDGSTKLSDAPFTPAPLGPHDTEGSEPLSALINESVELPEGTDRIAIYDDQAGREISSTPVGGVAPSVTVTNPQPGAQLPASGAVDVSWSSHDDDGDSLTHTVLYRPDAGASWTVLANAIEGSSTSIDGAVLAGSTNGTLRVVAHDGFHTAQDEVTGLSVPDKSPVVTIDTPLDGAVITVEQDLLLSGNAQTLGPDAPAESAYEWISDLDGSLGTGPTVLAQALSVGTHEVELRVATPEGQVGSATTTVVVGDAGQTPSELTVSYDQLAFYGNTTTPAPAPQSFEVYDRSGASLDWTATSDDPRVTLSANSGTTPATVEVSADTSGLNGGESFSAHVTVNRVGGTQDPLVVDVQTESGFGSATISPATIDFGRQALGTTGSPRDVTFTYNGAGSMTLGTTALAGAAPGEYALGADVCSGATLTTGQSCTVAVSYAPTSAGRRPAFLVLADSDSDAKWYVSLTGVSAHSFESKVVAWGSNEKGQLGSTSGFCNPTTPYNTTPCSAAPVAVAGLTDVIQVAASEQHTLALKSDGTVWAWGFNGTGELGNGRRGVNTGGPTPVQVVGLDHVKQVAAGYGYNGGLSLALKEDGTVWQWGTNPLCCTVNLLPAQVPGIGNTGQLTNVVEIAAGATLGACGKPVMGYALIADGTVVNWGPTLSQLGSGTSAASCEGQYVVQVHDVGPGFVDRIMSHVVAIAPSMALMDDGTVKTWGANDYGEMGNGRRYASYIWAGAVGNEDGTQLDGLVAVASTDSQRYALKGDGTVYAWGGSSDYGSENSGLVLGVGTSPSLVLRPTRVQLPTAVAAIQPGLAVASNGTAYGWGINNLGKAGTGTTDQAFPPAAVVGIGGTGMLDGVSGFAGGRGHSLAVTGVAQGPPGSLSAGVPVSLATTAGETFDEAIGSFDDSTASQAFDFSATVDWGDGSEPSGAVVSGPDGGPYQVGGAHTYTEAGAFDITVDVLGRDGDSVTLTGSATVGAATLTAISGDDVALVAGAPQRQSLGGFGTSNAADSESTFAATVDWGDGSPVEAAFVNGPPGGPFNVVGEHAYSRAGTFPLLLQVSGDDGSAVTITSSAVVAPASLTPGDTFSTDVVDGTVFSGAIASFLDGNPLSSPSHYSAIIDWGDGTQDSGTVSGPTGGPYTVGGSHGYADARPFTVTVTLNGPADTTATATTTLLAQHQQIDLTAAAAPAVGEPPLTTRLSYTVTNAGTERMWQVEVHGSSCESATFESGDDGNGALDPGEQWTFACEHTFDSAGTFTDVAWATGYPVTEGLPIRSENADTDVVVGDTTPPVVAVTGVTDGATYAIGSVPTAGCSTVDPDPGSGVATQATPETTGGPAQFTVTCSGATDLAGNVGNTAVAHYTVTATYSFSGFKQPVDNQPTVNRVKAGSAIPLKFSLGGDHGLQIFASGSPSSHQVTCGSNNTVDGIEQTVTAGASNLAYHSGTDTYIYVWKTSNAWKGTCRQLVLSFTDGSSAAASFEFFR